MTAPSIKEAFTQYRRKQIAELRPWKLGDHMAGISISGSDYDAGSPKPGDMIARNPNNHADQWLVAAEYFVDNFEPLATLSPPAGERREAIAPCTYIGPCGWKGDLASGLVQDEAGWKPITTAPKDGTRILWSCGDDKMSVIHWPEYDLCFEGGYWMPLPAPPIRSARDGGAEG